MPKKEDLDMSDVESDSEVEEQEEEKKEDLSNPLVVEKYKKAADIANQAVQNIVKAAAVDVKLVDLCAAADSFITEQTSKIYKTNKQMEKGIAFPTCISANNIVGHFCPVSGDVTAIKAGDVLKVDLGVHIDGFAAVVAHTFVVGGVVSDRKADVIAAAQTAAEGALRLLKPGNKNSQVSDYFAKVAAEYKVNLVQGVLSHQMDRFVLDGEQTICNRVDVDNKVEEAEFEAGQVWSIDVVFSTGEGKPKEVDDKPNIYKRNADQVYQLKRQASRQVFGEILKKYPTFPFSLRDFDAKTVRFGILECEQHGLLRSFPLLQEKEGETVAHIKYTVLLTSNQAVRITGLSVDQNVQSQIKIENNEIKQVLNSGMSYGAAKNKKKKNKKKKAAAPAAASEMDTTM